MQDKAISEALNRAFKDSPTNFNTIKGRNNHFKINLPESNSSAYCYIDCYQSPKMIELELVTIVVDPKKQPRVFKNKIEFLNRFKAERIGLEYIEVSFNRHRTQVELALIHLKFHYQEGKSKDKIALFSFNFEAIEKKNDVILEEVPIKKPFLQAQWHPFQDQYLVVLTTEGFEILNLSPEEGFYWTSSTSFRQIGVGERIVDFRLWPSQSGLKQFTIIAAGQSGAIHLLLYLVKFEQVILQPQEDEIISSMSPFAIKYHQTLKANFNLGNIGCLGIQQSNPLNSEFLLLFRRVSTIKNSIRSFNLIVSALVEESTTFYETPLLIIRGEDDGPEFQIPQNCLQGDILYFWCGQRFNQTNLKDQIARLNGDHSSIQRSKFLSKKLQTDILFEVPSRIFKFLIFEPTSIKILRKAETAHRYLFTSVAVEAVTLDLEEKNTSKKLEALFNDLSTKLTQMRTKLKQVSVPSMKTQLKNLKEEADERELDEVGRCFDSFIKEGQNILRQEKATVQNLYQEATNYAHEFEIQTARWRQLADLLSEIQHNSRKIEQLDGSSKQQNVHGGKIESIEEMTKYLVNRPLQISEKHRKHYQDAFEQQLDRLRQIEADVQNIAEKLRHQNEV